MRKVLVLSGLVSLTWAVLASGCSGEGSSGNGEAGGSGTVLRLTGGTSGAASGVGGTATGRRTGGTTGVVTGGRFGLGGFQSFTGGVPPTPTGGRATGGTNNPAGCPTAQPANRTNCTEGTGPCNYGNQQCLCGQFYGTAFQWSCGNAPPATGGTNAGSGGRATGGRGTGGSRTGGTPGVAGSGGTAGAETGGTAGTIEFGGTAGETGTAGTAGTVEVGGTAPATGGVGGAGPACVPGATCSTGFVCTPTGGGACICVGTTLTCFNVQGGAPGSGGAPETGGVPSESGGTPAETGGVPPETGGAPVDTGGAPAAGNGGEGGAATDCAQGLPCDADAGLTCTRAADDGGTSVCLCSGGVYIACVVI